jgi:tetratricopeptide (TPR) repeat protein
LIAFISVLVLLAGTSGLFAQGYTQAEYNIYQKAVSDGEDAIIEWVKANPESTLKQYAIGEFEKIVKDYLDKGEHAKVVSAAEKYLNNIDGEKVAMLFLAAWSSYYSQQYPKAAEYGEKIYNDPNYTGHLTPILARSYQQTGNVEKMVPYAEKLCKDSEPKDCYDLLPALMKNHAVNESWGEAAKYADLTIKAYSEVAKPAQVSQTDWDDFVAEEKSVAYQIKGRAAAESGSWGNVEKNYTNSRKLNPKDKVRTSEGYFYIGRARWNMEQIDSAMEAFARGSKMSGTPYAKPCRNELEKLYKATHNGSLAGLEEFLDRFSD